MDSFTIILTISIVLGLISVGVFSGLIYRDEVESNKNTNNGLEWETIIMFPIVLGLLTSGVALGLISLVFYQPLISLIIVASAVFVFLVFLISSGKLFSSKTKNESEKDKTSKDASNPDTDIEYVV